jgi:Carboxypeptidase regulatory-like domain
MNQRWLAPICAVLALGTVSAIRAQDNKMPVAFSSSPDSLTPLNDLAIRPNQSRPLYLFITNKSTNDRDTDISITDADGKTIYAHAKILLKDSAAPVRVKFVKPPPPMPPAGAAPAPPAPMPMPMVPPPPPGEELKPQYDAVKHHLEFKMVVRVGYEDNDKKRITETTSYIIYALQPSTYTKVTKIGYRNKDRQNLLTLDMESNKMIGPTPCPVDLVFPPQPGLNVNRLGEGVYHRLIAADNKSVNLYSKNLPISGAGGDKGRVYLTVDGVPRAFVYRPKLDTETEPGQDPPIVDPQSKAEIRFMLATKDEPSKVIFARPGIVPIRVEADLAQPGSLIQMKILRLPEKKVEVDSITRLAVREERIWLEPAAPEGVVLVTAKLGDWVIPVDARDYRGQYQLVAELIDPAGKTEAEKLQDSTSSVLAIDDTKPEIIKITARPLNPKNADPPRHVRTEPLPLEIDANDPESGIAKVVVFLGKPAPDGKIPETAVEALPPKTETGPWLAQLPLPMGLKGGMYEVTAVAVNGVGMTEVGSQKIQLIDPPLGGTIRGTVSLTPGGQALNGIAVRLIDGEGKEKGSAKTDQKKNGIFEMTDVPPGTYKVVAAKPDSGVGTKGAETVTVKAGEVTKVKILLGRRP